MKRILLSALLFAAAGAGIAAQTHPPVPVIIYLYLDVPHAPNPDWFVRMRVGDAEYQVPRAALRELVVAHPEWLVAR